MRKLIMMLGVTTGLLGITGGAGAAPRPYNAAASTPAVQESVTEAGSSLLRGYEQDGLTLQDDLKTRRWLFPQTRQRSMPAPCHLTGTTVIALPCATYFGRSLLRVPVFRPASGCRPSFCCGQYSV